MAWAPLPEKVTLTLHPPQPRAFHLHPEKTTLVVVDMQEHFVKPGARSGAVVEGNIRLLEKARAAGVKVIFVQTVRDPNAPATSRFANEHDLDAGSPGTEIIDDLTPQPNEIVVTKHGNDPFARTELDQILQKENILPTMNTIIVTGISAGANSGVLGFNCRHYLTLVPMDCQAEDTVEEEALIYAKYGENSYEFTLSEMIEFSPQGLSTWETVRPHARQY